MGTEDDLEYDVGTMLTSLGYYNETDPHFGRTPERAAKWLHSFKRHTQDEGDKLLEVVFPEDAPDSLVIVGPVEFRSMCAHHLLPVVGKAWVGYLPEDGICGLSKLARLVDYYAHQLTVQERVTNQVADAIERTLKPKGCMVVIRATHMCMSFRGILDGVAETTTSAVRGLHKESDSARSEFLSLVR